MKLATLKKEGGRDGQLVVVSRDLRYYLPCDSINTLQGALENWQHAYPVLKKLSDHLNAGEVVGLPFPLQNTTSPLPRAYQWLDSSAYVNHVELVRKSRGVEMPASFWSDPLMYQGGSDTFLAPHDPIAFPDTSGGIDFEAEVAVITTDVPMGISPEAAASHIALVLLVNDISLRLVALQELSKGFGFVQSKPSSAFSPIAVTPDELGDAWDGKKVHLPILSYRNDTLFGQPNAGIDMVFDFPTLIAHAAKTRTLSAGTILGSGTVSNRDRSVGSSCIVEKRTLELLETGEAKTPYLQHGDHVRIEMRNSQGESIFGAIDQVVSIGK